jgi:signal transduction histidine kinase/DNA-binding response OmpR family regulator/HPt (histidine-containing phosphotransfer) domain-containing protein
VTLSTPQKALAGFAIATLTLLGLITLITVLLNRSVENQQWVSHTYLVVNSLEGIVGSLHRAESAQRAFLISGDSRYFDIRDDAMSKVESLLIDVRELTSDNPAQQSRIPALANLIYSKLELMNRMAATLPAPGSDEAIRITDKDTSSTKAILVVVTEMLAEERWLLALRNAAVNRDATLVPAVLASVFLAFVIFLGLLFLRIRRDISAREEAEAALERERTVAIDARVLAESATRSKSEFLANMSHEIRTPMNAIMGLTHLALQTPMEPKLEDYLLKIQRSSRALLSIINDILDYSKIEAGRLDVESATFQIEEVLQGVGDLFMPAIEAKGLAFHIEVAKNVPGWVIGDSLRLSQIFNNLVGNAVKFTTTGEIHVCVELLSSRADMVELHFSVRDTGIGLSQNEMEHLFRPFSQADSSISRQYGGTGLGLTICRRLCELMGGTIDVESTPGQGSTFHFRLPFGIDTEINRIEHPRDLEGLRTLVVDDQEVATRIIGTMIESWRGRPTLLNESTATLDYLVQAEAAGASYDFLILDWIMPHLTGIDLAREIQRMVRQGALKQPPVLIMVTGHNRDKLLSAATDIHLDGIVTKPVVPSLLYDAISRARFPFQTGNAGRNESNKSVDLNAEQIRGAEILLVEDNMLNQEVAKGILENAGLNVTIANHGREGVDWVRRAKFDAVLMDLHMPGMDGFAATRMIRALPEGGALPIIAMTAAVRADEKLACLDAGMNDHVAKPIMPSDLFATLARWIAPRPMSDQALSSKPTPLRQTSTFPPIPGLDVVEAELRLDGNLGTFEMLLFGFVDQFSEIVALTEGDLTEGRLLEAARRVHTLGGVAANLSAVEIARLALKAELAIRQARNYDAHQILAALAPKIAALSAAIIAHRLTLVKSDGPTIMDERVDIAAWAGLLEALDANNLDAVDKFGLCRPFIAAQLGTEVTAKLDSAVTALRFKEVATQLRDQGISP